MRRWLAVIAGALTAHAAQAQPASVDAYMGQPQTKADARILYGPEPAQVVELFLPKGRGPHPVVVLIHGGCYLAAYEGLRQTSGISADLATRGYAVWNVGYRRPGDADGGYPGPFLDAAQAVDRIRTEAGRYRLDTRRVVAVGHSAGAHLALWAAARSGLPKDSELWRADPLRIQAVVSLGGIGDLKRHAGVFGGACGPAIAQVAPPRTYRWTSPAELPPTGAGVTMIHGELDNVMPFETGQAFAARVRAAGGRAEAVEVKGAGHFDLVIPTTAAWKTVVVPAVARAFGRAR